MTYPQQPDGHDPQTPPVPSSPQVPSPYDGTPAAYGQPTPTAQPTPTGQPPAASPASPYDAPAYGTPARDLPAAPVADPYSGAYTPVAPAGVQPMTWRTILAYVFGVIAVLFFPIIFGVLGIVFGALAVRRNEKTSRIALAVAIAGTVLGFIGGLFAQTM